jgi:hypothetical protein
MRIRLTLPAALLVSTLLAGSASAQCCYVLPPQAPDMCGPGSYCTNSAGQTYGPNYNVTPPFAPFQGMLLGPKPPLGAGGGPPGFGGGAGSLGFPSHLYARSPRDYFMIDVDPAHSPYTYGGVNPMYTPSSWNYSWSYSFSSGGGAAGGRSGQEGFRGE